jgi:hypothetical protein
MTGEGGCGIFAITTQSLEGEDVIKITHQVKNFLRFVV